MQAGGAFRRERDRRWSAGTGQECRSAQRHHPCPPGAHFRPSKIAPLKLRAVICAPPPPPPASPRAAVENRSSCPLPPPVARGFGCSAPNVFVMVPSIVTASKSATRSEARRVGEA